MNALLPDPGPPDPGPPEPLSPVAGEALVSLVWGQRRFTLDDLLKARDAQGYIDQSGELISTLERVQGKGHYPLLQILQLSPAGPAGQVGHLTWTVHHA